MTLLELLNRANEGYPDGFLSRYFDEATGEVKEGYGDKLAEFVVAELTETFNANGSDSDQVGEAVRVLHLACDELEGVISVLGGETDDRT